MAKKSVKFALHLNDWAKGFLLAGITTILTGAYELIQHAGTFDANSLKTLALTGVGSGIAYLLKNYLTTSDDKFLGKEKENVIK